MVMINANRLDSKIFSGIVKSLVCVRSKDNLCCNNGFKVQERSLLYNCNYIMTIALLLKLIFIYNYLINERRKSIKRKISVFQRSSTQKLVKKRLPATTTST